MSRTRVAAIVVGVASVVFLLIGTTVADVGSIADRNPVAAPAAPVPPPESVLVGGVPVVPSLIAVETVRLPVLARPESRSGTRHLPAVLIGVATILLAAIRHAARRHWLVESALPPQLLLWGLALGSRAPPSAWTA